jgi:hypothetical protein
VARVPVAGVPVAGMSGAAVAIFPPMGQAADRHHGESGTTQGEAEPIQVHTLNTT